jgi:hypothetical protein
MQISLALKTAANLISRRGDQLRSLEADKLQARALAVRLFWAANVW